MGNANIIARSVAMIRKERDELVVECEDCGEREYGGVLDFNPFVEWIKHEGWTIRNNGGDWEHRCPECSEGAK